jgi:hypothetical protein
MTAMHAECCAAKLSACRQLGDDEHGDPGAERGDQREAQRRGERGDDEPAVHRQPMCQRPWK